MDNKSVLLDPVSLRISKIDSLGQIEKYIGELTLIEL